MAKKLLTDAERFCIRYAQDDNGCWVWMGALDKDGYGKFKIGSRTDNSRRMVRPHRWSYEFAIGLIPDGMQIDHLCRNRACVNPAHLEAVTPLENHRRGLRALFPVCPKGHAIEGRNEVKRKGGHRCRICFNEWSAGYRRRTDYVHLKAYRQRQREAQSRSG